MSAIKAATRGRRARVYVHLMHETARHVGHADILREETDGVTGS